MDDLVEFLRARLDEDAEGAHNIHDRQSDGYLDSADCICEYPARILSEIESKRRIIGRINSHAAVMGRDEVHEDLLRLLAAPYADHPDYRQEWRP